MEALRRLEKKTGKKNPPQASPELWPGEHMDLGGFTLAKADRVRKARRAFIKAGGDGSSSSSSA